MLCQLANTSSEDSSSCSGESGRLRPGNGSRLRLGVRMGTRRHQLDYTSSSDQSCDTVIYVGSDGCPMSDQELTDYERPPSTTTAASDGRISVRQNSGGSGSLARVRGKSATFRSSLPRAVDGRHSDGELATSGRYLRGPVKPPWRSPPPPPPPLQRSAKKCGEMWIDGPKSMMTRVEQWVDGPPEFRLANDDNDNVEVTLESAEQQPSAIAENDGFTERQSHVEASAALREDFHVVAKFNEKKHDRALMQSPLSAVQSDVTDSNYMTKISDLQFTVVDVHQSAEGDSENTQISGTAEVHASPELEVAEHHRTSEDSIEPPSVERRPASGRTRLDVDALLLANRESIYELQMDEELESGSRESLLQLVCGSDDDWSTCGTEPRRSNCRESDGFRDLDACLKDLDDMEVTTSELPELKASNDAVRSSGGQQENEEESASINVVSKVAQQRDCVSESTMNCVESDCLDCNLDHVRTTVSFKTDSAAATTPTTNNIRQSALPMSVSSSPSRLRRKPPPVPVRSSSVSQWADRSTNGRATSTCIAVASTPPKTCSDVFEQKTVSDSKNGSASCGFCSKDCSAAREAEVTTGIAAVVTTNPPRGNGVFVDVVDSKQPASVPSPATKSRSRIALPCRQDKKNKHQTETSASSGSPSRSTTSPSVSQSGSPATASREVLAAVTLMSPYHSVTKPRASRGADSDNSSSVLSSERAVSASRIQTTTAARRRGGSSRGTRSEVEASSGYESMMRDSEEVTGTSSASECQSPLRLKANKIFRKKGVVTGTDYIMCYLCLFIGICIYESVQGDGL